jgi:transposase-like protein
MMTDKNKITPMTLPASPAKPEDDWTFLEKVNAVRYIYENNISINDAAAEIGVPRTTLQRWHQEMSLFIETIDKENNMDGNVVVTMPVDQLDTEFDISVKRAKVMTIKKVMALVGKERDLRKLSETLSTLNQISAKTQEGAPTKENEQWHGLVVKAMEKVTKTKSITAKVSKDGTSNQKNSY